MTNTTPKTIPHAELIRHAPWCQPQPGEAEPRIESYLASREDDRGRVISRPRVTRCQECAEQVVIG